LSICLNKSVSQWSNLKVASMLLMMHEPSTKKLEKIGRDPKVTAKAAGLRYVADAAPGYTRKKSGRAGAIMMRTAVW
jgi:hypothetical protein